MAFESSIVFMLLGPRHFILGNTLSLISNCIKFLCLTHEENTSK